MDTIYFKYQQPVQKKICFNNYPIHIWHIPLKDIYQDMISATEFLSEEELDRAKRIRVPDARNQYIKTRSSVRRILGRYLKQAPEQIKFGYTSYHKPFLETNTDRVEFNISHSSSYALCAISQNCLVGVDIERIKPLDNLDQLAANIFTADELSHYMETARKEKLAYFYRAWSRKEAFVKAQGKGFFHPINQLNLAEPSSHSWPTVWLPGSNGDKTHWTFNEFTISNDGESYQACVFWQGREMKIKHFQVKEFIT